MLLIAITAHVEPCFAGAELGRSAVLVSGADEQDLVSVHAPKPRMHVRRQHRACQIAKMLDAVDVRQCGGNQVTAHCCLLCARSARFGTLARKTALTLEPLSCAGGPLGHRGRNVGNYPRHTPAAIASQL